VLNRMTDNKDEEVDTIGYLEQLISDGSEGWVLGEDGVGEISGVVDFLYDCSMCQNSLGKLEGDLCVPKALKLSVMIANIIWKARIEYKTIVRNAMVVDK
jgi:hypothetical protein